MNFTIFDETFNVDSYAEMMIQAFNVLYEMDPSTFDELAQNEVKPFDSDRICITTNEKNVRRPRALNNSNVFIELNLSSKYILLLMKYVFEKYQIDNDDFYFFIEAE